MTTAAEWNAKTEVLKAAIAEQKHSAVDRQLQRERRRIALEDIADRVLDADIEVAKIGADQKAMAVDAARLALTAARDGLQYNRAKHQLQTRAWAVELSTIEAQLSGSEAKLSELRNVAATLQHKLATSDHGGLFGGASHG
jgi:hypothetical protein